MSIQEKDQSPQPKARNKKNKRISINLFATQYEILTQIAKSAFGWRIVSIEDETTDDSDLIWTDIAIQPERLSRLKPYQKINHFPGMHELARKNYLAKNLNKMQKLYPNDFNFYPKTWLYPSEFPSLKFSPHKNATYIVKPESGSQGKGIFLTRSLEGFDENEKYVIQEYLQNPMLIDGLKFDMRIYVLVAGCAPLKVFLHKEGLGRFATESYIPPNSRNIDNQCMHLTNYAINKNSEGFIFNSDPKLDNVGHKRSLTATLEKVKEMGFNTEKLWAEIKAIIVKTLCTAQPSLAHIYKACQADDPYNGICFEILGFDIILDSTGKPWLLEVNHSPSFNIDSPLDKKIKAQVISEALWLMNINCDSRKEYEDRKKKQILFRSLSHNKEIEKMNKKNDFKNAQARREAWEASHMGGYSLIFPDCNEDYMKFVQAGMKIWIESTGGKYPMKSSRPQTQETQVKVSVKVAKKTPDLAKTKVTAVFQRLYQVKKQKVEPVSIPPCVLLDEAYKTHHVKSQSPYSFIELVVPAKVVEEKPRHKSIPKKRVHNYVHYLDEVLKEKRAIEGLKRTFNIYEGPLQISSVISEELHPSGNVRAKLLKEMILRRLI